MTFVRTRLRIERMARGEILEIRLLGAEPLRSVPEALTELGHEILSLEPDPEAAVGACGVIHRLLVRKT